MNDIGSVARLLTTLLLQLFKPGEVVMITSIINQRIKSEVK